MDLRTTRARDLRALLHHQADNRKRQGASASPPAAYGDHYTRVMATITVGSEHGQADELPDLISEAGGECRRRPASESAGRLGGGNETVLMVAEDEPSFRAPSATSF